MTKLAEAIETCSFNVIAIVEKMLIGNVSERDSTEALLHELEALILVDRHLAATGVNWWVLATGVAIGWIIVGPLIKRFWQGFHRTGTR